jgi:hypothetical protein
LPDLIKKYEELEFKYSTNLGSQELQKQLDLYEATGHLNVEAVEQAQKIAE